MIFFKSKDHKNLEKESGENEAQVIAFLNQKGGVGKTTMAYHTAYALREKGHKVLCLDLDPQANLSYLFGVDTELTGTPSLYQLLVNSLRELKGLHTPLMWMDILTQKNGVDLLPAGQELSGIDLTLSSINNFPKQLVLKRFFEISGLLKEYDKILIDAPPTLGLIVINILCASDGIVVPFKADDFSRKGLGHLNDVLADIADMGITKSPHVYALIPNMVDLRRKQEGSDLEKIAGELSELPYLANGNITQPFFNRAPLVRCQAQKKSVFDYQSKEFQELKEHFNTIADLICHKGQEQTSHPYSKEQDSRPFAH